MMAAASCEESVQQRLLEHSYAKQSWVEPVAGDQEEPMDTSTSSCSMTAHETLTALNSNEDTFEVFLLTLLRAHSASQLGNTAEGDIMNIAPESLSSLTFEQIQSVMTSTSVNYNVVQQILAQKETLGKPATMDVDDEQQLRGEAVGGEGDSKIVSSVSGGVSSSGEESSQGQIGPLPPTQAQLGAAGLSIKLTADQLTQLQAQVSELLLQQSVLPTNLSPIQQQAFVQSLIAKQLNIQQQPMVPVKNLTASPKSSHNGHHQLQEQLGLKEPPSPTSSSSSTASSVQLPPPSKRKKDSDTKRPRTPFNLYFSDVYSSVQSENPKLSFSEASKIVSKRWNQLGQEGKQKYYDQHELLKADFKQKSGADDTELTASKPKSSKADAKKERRPSIENKIKPKVEEVERVKEPGMCMVAGCYNMAAEGVEEKGGNYCSNECVVKHCKNIFQSWIGQRKHRS